MDIAILPLTPGPSPAREDVKESAENKISRKGAKSQSTANRREELRLCVGSLILSVLLWLLVCCAFAGATGAGQALESGSDSDVVSYISAAWNSLTRSMSECKSLIDPKLSQKAVLYLPADFAEPAALTELQSRCSVDVEHLPVVIHHLGELDTSKLRPGLLYLPDPYVVPGGMFNEMYGWDSYFIIRGLLEDGNIAMARNMVENFLFEIAHYGEILNSNRTYHLTRSQPPFLTGMIRAVYEAESAQGKRDRAWIEHTYPYAVTDYKFWVTAPHLAGATGLSRYYDFGDSPAPELGPDTDRYFRGVVAYLLLHGDQDDSILVKAEGHAEAALATGPSFSVLVCDQGSEASSADTARAASGCDKVENLMLSRDFYKGDRSMRESGYDISFRFGPFGAATHHYAAVDLNSLLYKVETDLSWMSRELGRENDAADWDRKAQARRSRIDQYCWNAQRGLYFDYDFEKGRQSTYEYATTFYPLWVGAASPEQAKAVEQNFALFDRPGGIDTSPYTTGAQWDNPYGWAPVQLIAEEGLRRYGDSKNADLVSQQFLSMVAENFRHDGTIREKYNVVTRSSETRVNVGYSQNQIGFGWTNGAYLVLRHELR
jgi:alpha,alpha-trehalase